MKGSMTMCIMKHMSQEPRKSTVRNHVGVTCQPVFWTNTWNCSCSASTAWITATSSSRTVSNSTRYWSFTCCKYIPATTMAPPWTTAASIIMTLAIHWYSCCCSSGTSRAFSIKAAATTTGKIRKKQGNEPISMSAKRIFRIPVITAVGQSGPPIRTATLSGCRPPCVRTRSTAFIVGEYTPTAFRTVIFSEKTSPMSFCNRMLDTNLMAKQKTVAMTQPQTKPTPSCSHLRTTTIPEIK
mmetsp:Transcript_32085/g.88438  ORF Transcript_32085/g.88438 Transcript_32085/m.88438 type:complete len:240 (+) Transcript_32085:325-1044(+)